MIPGVPYECDKIHYTKEHIYHPDWTLRPGVYLECKGRFTPEDRAKHLLIKQQHPDVTVYFIFTRPYNTLNKRSTTTYADWCDKNDIEWTSIEEGIPKHWIKPNGNKKSS